MALLQQLARLQQQLLVSGIQKSNNALYQVINQLIGYLKSIGDESSASTTIIQNGIVNATYLTSTDQTGLLPNSRRLVAGTNASLDISTPGQEIINVSIPASNDYVVASDGAVPTPSPINDGFGNFIYISYTP